MCPTVVEGFLRTRVFAFKCLRHRHSVLCHVVQQLLQLYQSPAYGYGYGYQDLESLRRQRQRADALAVQRARRAQYLPEEDYSFGSFRPRERAYLNARRRQEVLENKRRRREEEAEGRRQQLEELMRQEIARILCQAVELERNRREQARPFCRGETATDHVSL